MTAFSTGRWSNGFAEWVDGDTVYLSVAFTWRLNDAYARASWYRQAGYRVIAGGPGVFTRKHFLADVAEVPTKRVIRHGKEVEVLGDLPDAVSRHNPMSTFASRGCEVDCWWCIVPKMEGKEYTEFPDFVVRPVLCDNNLSGLPFAYQKFIVDRYKAADIPLLDANSGFSPITFNDEMYALWSQINRGPWRFAYDCMARRPHVERVMRMLKAVSPRRKRVYVMIGNETMAECLQRLNEVIAWGGEPHAQPYMKLNALEKRSNVRFDWSEQSLRDVARWANRYLYKYTDFEGYQRSARTGRVRDRAPEFALEGAA